MHANWWVVDTDKEFDKMIKYLENDLEAGRGIYVAFKQKLIVSIERMYEDFCEGNKAYTLTFVTKKDKPERRFWYTEVFREYLVSTHLNNMGFSKSGSKN